MSEEVLDQIWRQSNGLIGSGPAFDHDAMRENIISWPSTASTSVLDQSLVNPRPLVVVLELWSEIWDSPYSCDILKIGVLDSMGLKLGAKDVHLHSIRLKEHKVYPPVASVGCMAILGGVNSILSGVFKELPRFCALENARNLEIVGKVAKEWEVEDEARFESDKTDLLHVVAVWKGGMDRSSPYPFPISPYVPYGTSVFGPCTVVNREAKRSSEFAIPGPRLHKVVGDIFIDR
ncbi:hypothetical protein B0H17DRAFT_1133137 [Mycena rosella]|uniref:Uncharacterized protein n=1 Tax=Mycena rosella TaxID=1033263 RepID=A0AAD7GFG6_MYCRO|nr:hypothetical protein B0H17DRAFT_1133137 [Mycena rosella]